MLTSSLLSFNRSQHEEPIKCIYDSAYYLKSFIAGKVHDEVKGKAGKASRGRPWYFIAAAAAGLVLCVVILVAWIVYCTRGRRSAAKERVKEDFTFNNLDFVSGNTKHPDPDMNA